MRRMPSSLRAALVVGAALAVVGATAAPAAAQSTPTPFFADFEDRCGYAYTEGTLTWPDPTGPGIGPGVPVQGVVGERGACPPETGERRVFAEFTAYAGGRPVDYRTEYVHQPDDRDQSPVRKFEFVLTNRNTLDPIERIEIRACRDHGPWLPAFECGETSVYWPTLRAPTAAAGA